MVSLVPELEPTEFVATAVSVYFTPLTTFEMLHELVPKATVQLRVVWSVAVAVMVYPMMLEPLLSVGGVQRNWKVPLRAASILSAVGLLGTAASEVDGVIAWDTADAALFPMALVALAVNV